MRLDVREILGTLCKYKGVEIIEGAVCADHVHMCVSIPPKISISNFMGYLKGKSTLMIYDRHPEQQSKWNKAFWARGYYVATVGNVTEDAIKKYIGRLFKIVHCCPVGGAFASRLQYPGIDQVRQYGIQVILELMPVPDLAADPVESESVIDGLEEKVSAFIKFLAAIIQLSVSVERHKDRLCLFFSFIVFCFQSGLLPRPLHHAVPVSAERFGKFLEGAKFPDSFGSASAIAVYVGLGYIKGFRIFRFRCRYFHVVFPPYSVSLYIATENLTKKYRLYAACRYFLRYGAVKDPSTLF